MNDSDNSSARIESLEAAVRALAVALATLERRLDQHISNANAAASRPPVAWP
jgi:outer membrane murein-binding lipoprotein Lpp